LGVLAELLVCAAPGVPNMLLDLVEHGPNEDHLTLVLLRSDLEACLLPLNRGATRRVLSRLVREVRKAPPGPSSQVPAAEVGDVDATFDDLLGDTSPPLRAARAQKTGRVRSEPAQNERPRGVSSELPRGVGSSRPASERTDHRGSPSQRRTEERTRGHASSRAEDEPDVAASRRALAPAEEHTALHVPRAQRTRERAESRRPSAAADSGERSDAQPARRSRQDSAHARERLEAEAQPARRSGQDSARATAHARERLEAEAQPARRSQHDSARAAAQASERPARGSVAPRSRAPLDVDALVEAQAARGRAGLWVFLGTTAVAVAMLLAYFALGREQSQSALGFLKPAERSDVPAVKPPPAPRRAYGDLRVNSRPDRAQVLLLIGPGPALATDIPLGVAQEFVALAEEHRSARALLPADAVWDELDGQPRYELAIQARPLPEGRHSRSSDALGPTLLPQNVGAPTGRLGAVRVVTTPRAAQVYQLIGFTPDVHVDNLPLDHAYELLVYAEGRGSVRKRIEPSDFHEQNGKRVAQLDLQLPAAE
jgi:hypothetical protein